MKINNKILILLFIVTLVVLSIPASQKFFLAQVSNVSVFVPGGQITPTPENSSGGGGSAYYLTSLSPKETPVAIEEQATPTVNPLSTPIATPAIQTTTQNQLNQESQASLLPAAVADLTQKIPQLAQIFSNLNVKTPEDVSALQTYNIYLPGLNKVTNGQASNAPTDTVFVELGNGNIDASTELNLGQDSGSLEKVHVQLGKPMELVVRPSQAADGVFGYILFIPGSAINNQNFVISKFDYTNNGGVYSAKIMSPSVEGSYQIVTSINYADKSVADRVVKTTTLVDPDGYVYEQTPNGELRIKNSTVSLYQLNSKNQYVLWNASDYGQENPQITDNTGNYSFLVPVGTYYIEAKASGYNTYKSDPISVLEGKEVHSNIELKKQVDIYSLINFQNIFLGIIFCLVMINFYLEMRRVGQSRKK